MWYKLNQMGKIWYIVYMRKSSTSEKEILIKWTTGLDHGLDRFNTY